MLAHALEPAEPEPNVGSNIDAPREHAGMHGGPLSSLDRGQVLSHHLLEPLKFEVF